MAGLNLSNWGMLFNALRMKLSDVWNWLVKPAFPTTKEKTSKIPKEQQSASEIIQQIKSVDDSIKYYFSTIDNKLTSILEQQKLIREEQERLRLSCDSICTQHEQQMAILSELMAAKNTMLVYNQKQDLEDKNSVYKETLSFKELYCRQLCKEKDAFNVNDLTDSPNSNCYIIKQYDETHATLNIVDDPLVRSQMISGFTDLIVPVCDFDGQQPTGKEGFKVKKLGELEIYNNKWLIKKKIEILFC